MDESNTLERRYSFNMTQGYPIAESTRHNGISFSWGSSKSSKDYSNSILPLNKTDSSFGCINKSISIRTSKKTKIDPRIATDVQSTGLASRIVKYHENGTRLNRSMSAHNLYSKPGQFPAVTLKKTELPYRASKQELSMIKIPAPEKSSFYGNTISSLLRSSSVIGLQPKRTEDLSRENRPIIHPPPTDNDMAPTRSVLDVLKEISRKRINSDDLDSEEEASKKYCNRASYDTIDTNEVTSGSNSTNLNPSCQRHKRQRDCMTPCQVVHLSETKTSPEQAKKRVCNYNNDITSSLSSSTKSKRKSALDQTMLTNKEWHETQKSKMQRYDDHLERQNSPQVDIRFNNLENTLRRVDPINCISPISENHCARDQNNINEIVPPRTESEAFYSLNRKNTNLVQPAHKPRLTLFNKRCEDSDSYEHVAENTKDVTELNDCADIPFVKPKKMTKSGLKNPVMERTQRSKLALMLSGLRGELYQNSQIDELDAPKDKETPQTIKDKTTNATASAAVKPNTIPNLTSFGNPEISTKSNKLNSSSITTSSTSPPTSNDSVNKTSSPLVGLKLSQPNISSEKVCNMLTVDAPKITEITQSSSCAGLSFDTANKISTSLINAPTPNKNIEDHKHTEKQILSISTESSNIPNFGQPTQITSSLTLDNEANKISESMHLSANKNSLKFPAVCTAFSALTTNTDTYSNMASCSAGSKASTTDSNVIASSPTSLTSTPVWDNTTVSGAIKLNHAYSFSTTSTSLTTTSTSSVPIMFSNLTSSTFNASPLKSIVAASTVSADVTSANINCLTSTPMFTFNSNNKPTTNATTTVSSNVGVLPVSFKFDKNLSATSNPSFGTNTNSVIKTQPTNLSFTFSTDANTQSCSPHKQNNHKTANQTGNEALQSNASTLLGSQSLETKTTGGSTAIFGNSSIPIFGSSSVKTANQSFEFSTNNKSEESVAPNIFGSNTSTPFSFGLKSVSTPTTNNGSSAPGGFSFNSAVSSNAKSGTFGIESKSNEHISSSSNIFRSTSDSAVQNKGFTFGLSENKTDNPANIFGAAVTKQTKSASPGGFSFGSATPVKTSTFTFGNKPSANAVTNANNQSTGFSFGTPAASKSNEMQTNKPFSFGSPQPIQQEQIQPVTTSNASSLNIFGAVTKTAQPPAFNFNPGSSTNLQSNTSTGNNLFLPSSPNVTTGPSDRPIRRATRRLQK